MSISDKTKKALEKIGLTSYEIRTFSALLKAGEQTGGQSLCSLGNPAPAGHPEGLPLAVQVPTMGSASRFGWGELDPQHPRCQWAVHHSPAT